MGALHDLHARKNSSLGHLTFIILDKTPIQRCFNICEKIMISHVANSSSLPEDPAFSDNFPGIYLEVVVAELHADVTRSRWCSLSCSTSMVALVFKHIHNVKLNLVVCILLEVMTFWEYYAREMSGYVHPNRAQIAACPCCLLNGSCYFSDRVPVIGFRCRGIQMNSKESFS